MNTSGYGGKSLTKQISVLTDDPENDNVALRITGEVEVVVTVAPSAVKLNGILGADIHQDVTITPSPKYPFNIVGHKLLKGTDIAVALEPVETSETAEKKWKLTISNTRETLGRYYDAVTLETDSPVKPEIMVRVFGNINNALPVTATPAIEKKAIETKP